MHRELDRPYLVGLLGVGVGASLTPPMHMEEAKKHGLTYVYRTIDTGPTRLSHAELRSLLDSAILLGYDGLNVTFPYKQQILPLLDELGPTATRLGAVNTVLVEDGRLEGHNTDVTGFATALNEHLPDASMRSVVQLGAGGAGAAVADALLGRGAQELTLVDPDIGRARQLAEGLVGRFQDSTIRATDPSSLATALARADGLVNCTPIGMAHHPGTPLEPGLLCSDLWVADIVYRPLQTELLRHASQRGCRVLHGGFMAVYQAARTFDLITGRAADPERMLAHLELLVSEE